MWWRALGCDVGRGITSSLLSPAPRRQSSTKEPPAAFGVTVPHTTAAPRAHFTVGRGFSAGKVAKPSQQVWAVQMGNGDAPGAAPSLPPLLSEERLETHPGGKGSVGILFPVLWVSPREHQHRWKRQQRFGIPALALGFLGTGRFHTEPVGLFHTSKIFINVMGGSLKGCKCHFLKSSILCFSCWISFLGKMEPNESLAAWQSAEQHVYVQEDRKERVKLFVGPPWWEQNFLMKVYPETGRI